MRALLSRLHDRFERLGLKGHRLCRLPGVAVTCLGVVVARGAPPDLALDAALARAHDLLHRDLPCVDFDAFGNDASELRPRGRPTCALQVLVHETNVASRVTTGTTRHLLDTLAWTIEARAPPSSVRAWRVRTMFACARMRPRGDDPDRAVALTLHAAVSRLDGHPLVECVLVDAHVEETTDLLVRVTLDPAADYDRYGFRGDESIARVAGVASVVMVQRTPARSWPLCTHPAEFAAHLPPRLARPVDDEVCVPNAPHLTNDVAAYFDARHWTRVDA